MKKNIILTQRIGFFIALIISGYTTQSAQAEISSTEKSWVTITNGCKLWTYPYDNVTWTWSGKCVDGYADGIGILQQHVSGMSDGDLFRYEGNLVHGIKSGKGAYFAGGQKYRYKVEGEFDNDVINGPCKYTSKSSAQFNGTCKNDQKENGTEITADGIVLTLVNGEIKNSSYQSGNTDSASEHRLGTIFKALAGAVVSVKTGDSTLLNQAVQEANNQNETSIVSDFPKNSKNSYYSDVKKGLDSKCITVGSAYLPYGTQVQIEFINSCGQPVDVFFGNPGNVISYSTSSYGKDTVGFDGNVKTIKIAVCPSNYLAVKPNFQQIIESRGKNYIWDANGPFYCWRSPQPN